MHAVRAVKTALREESLSRLRSGLILGKLPPPSDARCCNPSKTVFALASCHYPSDILDHMPNDEHCAVGPADASLVSLAKLLREADPPTLLLLAGDQIYADATAGLFDPKSRDDQFRVPYERRSQSRGAKAVMQRLDLRVKMMIDDHEIRDNWEADGPSQLLADAKIGYFTFQRMLSHTPRVWHSFRHQGIPFFFGDTRTEREDSNSAYLGHGTYYE